MPSRSSRSRPASFTSVSEPTGSASRAMAIPGNLTTEGKAPVVRLADLPQPCPRRLVAEGAGDAGLVEAAGIEAEGFRRLVVTPQVGVEHRRVVRRDRAPDSRVNELRQRVLLERAHGARAEVRQGTDVEHGAAAGELTDEPGILGGADAVAEAVRRELLERALHRCGAGQLSRVRHRPEAERLRELEDVLVRLGRELRLEAPKADADDAPVAVARRPFHGFARLVEREAACDVGSEPDLDAVQLPRLLCAVADAFEDVLPRAAVPHALGRAEDAFEVDGAVRRRLGR